jgi:hypothetical protein
MEPKDIMDYVPLLGKDIPVYFTPNVTFAVESGYLEGYIVGVNIDDDTLLIYQKHSPHQKNWYKVNLKKSGCPWWPIIGYGVLIDKPEHMNELYCK